MRIEIKTKGIELSNDLTWYLHRRWDFAFSRLENEVESALWLLEDVNGPKGGVDKRCRLTISGPRIGTLSLDEVHSDERAAIDLLLERVARATIRALERSRSKQLRSVRATAKRAA